MINQNHCPKTTSPYRGRLINLIAHGEERNKLLEKAKRLPSLQLSLRSLCDIDLLATGAFSPLKRFMGKADYTRVLKEMRLADGTLFPMPITLTNGVSSCNIGDEITLCSPRNEIIAIMRVEEEFERDISYEAVQVCGTTDMRHPLAAEMASWGRFCLSGPLQVLNLPKHYNFTEFRRTPAEIREWLKQTGYSRAVAFQTGSLICRTDEEFMKTAAEEAGGALLIQAVFDPISRGEIDPYTRIRTYRILFEKYYDRWRTILNILPLATRMSGLRECLWYAIIQRNYGADCLILGRDNNVDINAKLLYESPEAQESLDRLSSETEVRLLPYTEPVQRKQVVSANQPEGNNTVAGMTVTHRPLRPEVAAILGEAYPPRHQQGFCIWLTGLPCAGKSTISEIVAMMLQEYGKKVTLLDGDVVRTHLSKGLGFTKEDRDTNVRRIGFVASEIVRHNGVAVCATVSPYCATRNQVRNMVGKDRFIEVFVNTPLEVCEQRDSKGLYAKARMGKIKGLTGVDDPYEVPVAPEITLTTTDCSPEDNARKVIGCLIEKGFLLARDSRIYEENRCRITASVNKNRN